MRWEATYRAQAAQAITGIDAPGCQKLAGYLANRAPGLSLATAYPASAVSLACLVWRLVSECKKRSAYWQRNENKRLLAGAYRCAGCGQALFRYEQKFESGTGWPSFFDVLDGAVETKRNLKLLRPRTEYHCSRCGGHQGHVFEDGPQPTGRRYCNNGVALSFSPEEA